MKQFLRNVASVVLLHPDWYRIPRRPALEATIAGTLTVGAAWAWFGPMAMWVIAAAYFMAILVLPCKMLALDDLAPDDEAIGPALLRALFASMVATWPLGLALAADLPAEVIAGFALHGAMQIWLQVVLPRAPAEYVAEPDGRVAPADRHFAGAGPAIGTFGGREIAAWLVDVQGRFWDFVGCTSDRDHLALHPGQAVLGPGIIYEMRRG